MREADDPSTTTLARELIEAPATIIALAIFLGALFAICGG